MVQLQADVGVFRRIGPGLIQRNLVEGQLLDALAGDVFKVNGAHAQLLHGDRVQIVAAGGAAVIAFDDGTRPHPKSRTTVAPGTRVTLLYPGGGGYGDPATRDPEALAADIRDGYVSAEGAKRDYGVKP